ncbi:tRNA epoxyqueuosine(34) reductase QueG [Patescibacteria group bacterium]|nr:tRNA epoxyqueuosine(34) reductase QueG [Patescibacteria group bacterium]MBU1702998.1 tRNA epoxyqueuosine(34) reductase QueG [Patescibacteria group bacterium]
MDEDFAAATAGSSMRENLAHLKGFIEDGRQGGMKYLEDYGKRVSPEFLLPGARSVVAVGVNYYRAARAEEDVAKDGAGIVARYAYGRDYHKVMRKLLKEIAGFIGGRTRVCVDSAPLLEKAYAVAAGLGFIGKNTTLITPELGSWVLLGEIITDLELTYDKPVAGTCGNCTRCLEACPTKALIGPKKMDARRCISYLTIEHKGPIADDLKKGMGKRIFGCDICQEVCPYNLRLPRELAFKGLKESKIAGGELDLKEILEIGSDEEFLRRFAGSPLMRAGLEGMRRNAGIAMGDEG